MRKNVAGQTVGAQLITAADGSAFTGAVTAFITLDAGTQAQGTVGSGACTHEGNGYHTYAPSQAETNGNLVAVTFTGSGAIPVTVQIYTTSLNPHDTVRAGLTALPNAAADAAGGLPISDAGGLNLDAILSTGIVVNDFTTAAKALIQTEVEEGILAQDFATLEETADAVWDEDATGHQTAGSFGATVGDGAGAALSIVELAESAANDADTIKTYILTLPPHTPGTVADAAATTTSFKTDLDEPDDFWNDAILTFTTGNLTGQSRVISDYAETDGVITLDEALSEAPADTDGFTISPSHIHSTSQIAAAVLAAASATPITAQLGDVAHGGASATLQLGTFTVTTNAVAWNASWDTEVQSEVADELAARGVTSTVTGRIDAAISTVATQVSVNDLPTNAELATAIITGLTTALTEGYRTTGATGSVRDLLYEILQNLTEFENAGTTKTVKKLDGSTTAKVYTYDDGTSPTSITETT